MQSTNAGAPADALPPCSAFCSQANAPTPTTQTTRFKTTPPPDPTRQQQPTPPHHHPRVPRVRLSPPVLHSHSHNSPRPPPLPCVRISVVPPTPHSTIAVITLMPAKTPGAMPSAHHAPCAAAHQYYDSRKPQSASLPWPPCHHLRKQLCRLLEHHLTPPPLAT